MVYGTLAQSDSGPLSVTGMGANKGIPEIKEHSYN